MKKIVWSRDLTNLITRCSLAFALLNAQVYATAHAQDSNTASMTIEVIAKSVPARGTKYKVTQYADEQCAKRGKTDRLLEKRNAKDGGHVFKTIYVDTSSNFIFQVMLEHKKLRQLKSCSALANLEMQAGNDYRAVYEVNGVVLGCSLTVYNLSADPVAVRVPDDASINDDAENSGQGIDASQGDIDVLQEDTDVTEEGTDVAQDADAIAQGPVKVDYIAPELACMKIGKTGFKNNVPVHAALDLQL